MSGGDPHNHLFRYVFTRPEQAREHFASLLPASVVSSLDWSTLELRPETHIDARLRLLQTDILYRVRMHGGGFAYLYLLLEHQSKPHYQMPFRFLQYMVSIWQDWIAEQGGPTQDRPLPLIIPLVLYNGERSWTVTTELGDLLGQGPVQSALREHIPNFRYIVQDLSRIPDEDLQGMALRQMVLLCLKWGRHPSFWQHLEEWLDTLATILHQDSSGLESIEALLRYIAKVVSTPPPPHIYTTLRERLSPKVEEILMTWAEQLQQQGIEQGIEQGIAQGISRERQRARERLLRQLVLKFGPVSPAVQQRVEQATAEDLDAWTERILWADSAASVVGD